MHWSSIFITRDFRLEYMSVQGRVLLIYYSLMIIIIVSRFFVFWGFFLNFCYWGGEETFYYICVSFSWCSCILNWWQKVKTPSRRLVPEDQVPCGFHTAKFLVIKEIKTKNAPDSEVVTFFFLALAEHFEQNSLSSLGHCFHTFDDFLTLSALASVEKQTKR